MALVFCDKCEIFVDESDIAWENQAHKQICVNCIEED